jgi:hypothetical protein
MAKYKQGFFKPINPEKYKGNVKRGSIVYRSGWELKLMSKLDKHPDVLQWSSEEVVIPYKSPVDNRYHRYFVDFYVEFKDKDGNLKKWLIEVKPKKQVMAPVRRKNQREKTFLNEVLTWGVNSAKWEAAKKACVNKGWEFKIFTEDELGVF